VNGWAIFALIEAFVIIWLIVHHMECEEAARSDAELNARHIRNLMREIEMLRRDLLIRKIDALSATVPAPKPSPAPAD